MIIFQFQAFGAAAHVFIGSNDDLNGAVRQFRVFGQRLQQGDHNGHTGFVVGA